MPRTWEIDPPVEGFVPFPLMEHGNGKYRGRRRAGFMKLSEESITSTRERERRSLR